MDAAMESIPAPLAKGRLNASVPVLVIAPGYHGHAIARTLGRLGVAVYGIHADRHSPAAGSHYWRKNYFWDIEQAPPEESVNWLLDIGHKIAAHASRPILIPTDDKSCVFVDDYAHALREAFLFPNQPTGLTRLLSNKETMYYLCKKHGIPAAETSFPQSRDDVIRFIDVASFPVLLKGIDTLALRERTGVKMIVANDGETLLKLYDKMETPECPNIMLQEYLPGGSQTVCMFDGYFNEESECLFGLTAKMIRQYPAYTGVTSLGICVTNECVAQQAKKFMKAVGYRGPLDIGFRLDVRTGQYKAIDVNPRIGRTFRLLVDSLGMDAARALYLDMTGQPVVTGAPREGRKWVVENFDLLSSPTYCRDDKLNMWKWMRTYRGVEEAGWFARDDPAPFFMMGWSSLRWVFARLFARFRKPRSLQSVPEESKQLVRPGATL